MCGCLSIRGRTARSAATVDEDFGDLAGHVVDIGENRMVGPARRWAVALHVGGLVFIFSSTATSWPPSSLAIAIYPPSGTIFAVAAELRTKASPPARPTRPSPGANGGRRAARRLGPAQGRAVLRRRGGRPRAGQRREYSPRAPDWLRRSVDLR